MKNIVELPCNYNGEEPIFQTYNVDVYGPTCILRNFYAYVCGGYVYPYRGNYTDASTLVGLYLAVPVNGGPDNHVFIHPKTESAKEMYSVDNIIELSPPNIDRLIDGDKVKEQNYDMLISEGETFKPVILDKDNVPQRVIKKAICDKNIDLRLYAHKFRSFSDYSNHKRSILNHKLTWEKFDLLCNILDLDWTLSVQDKPSCPNPMNDVITVTSIE